MTDKVQPVAFQLLSRLFHIIDLHVPLSTFANGVTHSNLDEGEANALRLLREIRTYLSENGDDYARDIYPTDDQVPFLAAQPGEGQMITCAHCDAEFPIHQVMAFVRHLQEVHGIRLPLTLGYRGACTTEPRPCTPYSDSWSDGTAFAPEGEIQ